MRSFNNNFLETRETVASSPVTVSHFHFPGGELLVSDRSFPAAGSRPEILGLVTSWGGLSDRLDGLFPVGIPEMSVELVNPPDAPFSAYLESGTPEDTEVELFQWFEGMDYADREMLGRFVMASPITYSDGFVRLSLVCAFIKRNRTVGDVISRGEFPEADPDSVGRTKGIIYGAPKNVLCHPVVAGAVTTLASDVTASQTSGIALSMSPDETPVPPSGILQIGKEKLSYAGISGKTLTGVTRGAQGTSATAHKKGETAFQPRSDFTYLVADHPVKSIGDVYVGGVRVTSGVTRKTDDSGRATVVFSDKFTLEKAVDLSVSDPPHTHSVSGKTISLFGNVGQIGYGKAALYSNVPASTPDYGPISAITVKVTLRNLDVYGMGVTIEDNTGYWHAYAQVQLSPGDTSTITVPADSISSPGMDWSTALKVKIDSPERLATVETVEFIVTYAADAASSPAGVSLNGSSTADFIVGGKVTCDVEGFKDDASGTFTGAPGALIENPADVFRHFLSIYMSVPQGELGQSFTEARAALSQAFPGGCRFSGVISAPVECLDLLDEWAGQSRLILRHDGNSAGLVFVGETHPAAGRLIGPSMIKLSSLKVTRTGKEEVLNKAAVHFDRDYSRLSNSAESYFAVCDSSALYPSGGDPASVEKFGPRDPKRPIKFGFVSDGLMAEGLRDFFITRFKDTGRRVSFTAFLDNLELQPGDIIGFDYATSALDLTGAGFFVEATVFTPGSARDGRPDEITIQAREV